MSCSLHHLDAARRRQLPAGLPVDVEKPRRCRTSATARLRLLCRELPEPCANTTMPTGPTGTVRSPVSSPPRDWMTTGTVTGLASHFAARRGSRSCRGQLVHRVRGTDHRLRDVAHAHPARGAALLATEVGMPMYREIGTR